jgi:RNA polymerase sigma factor (sigma-70 family)
MFLSKRKKYKLKTDEELVELYKQEQSDLCITFLYQRYAHLVMGVSLKYLKNQMDAEDITMHIFETLPPKILQHTIQNFKSWLYIVTRNDCFMLLRKQKKEVNFAYIDQYQIPQPEEDFNTKEIQLQLLEQVLDTIKPEQKQCLTLFYLEEKSYLQISIELGIAQNTVKSAIQNGKRNIKQQLEQENAFNKTI